MPRFYGLAKKEISNFAGIYYSEYNVENALDTLKTSCPVILGIGKAAISAFTLGFDAYSMSAMNVFPELVAELYGYVLNYRLKEAQLVQDKIFERIYDIYKDDEDFIVKIKTEFNNLNLGFKVGATRKPLYTEYMIRHWMGARRENCNLIYCCILYI